MATFTKPPFFSESGMEVILIQAYPRFLSNGTFSEYGG